MRRVPRPDKSVPILEADGKTISQAWFDYLGYLDVRGVSFAADVSATSPTNGQVLTWNTTTKLWTPAAN